MRETLQVKFKKLREDAVVPTYAMPGDACMDITAVDVEYDLQNDRYIYHTGLAFEVPEGYYMDLRPRSSNTKTDVYIPNAPGTLDSGYRGELLVVFKNRDKLPITPYLTLSHDQNTVINAYANTISALAPYKVGERVCQMMILPYPKIELVEVTELSETERGDGGFGHTGK
jgi:dUTP pyrophosphatase